MIEDVGAGAHRHQGASADRGRRIDRVAVTPGFALEMVTGIEVARPYIDRWMVEHNAGRLDSVDAAKAKWWTTELLQGSVCVVAEDAVVGGDRMFRCAVRRCCSNGGGRPSSPTSS
jgi:hypothetical protein